MISIRLNRKGHKYVFPKLKPCYLVIILLLFSCSSEESNTKKESDFCASIHRNDTISLSDTLEIIRTSCEAAAKTISPFENDTYAKVTYFKIVNKTAFVLLDVHQNGWSGAWDFKRKIEPIIEKSIIKFQQIDNVQFDYAPGDKKREY